MASFTRARTVSAPASAARTISSTAFCARPRVCCAEPTVAWIVRSTASRTASGMRGGVVLRLAIRRAVSHIVPRPMSTREPIHLNPATQVAERVLLPGDPQRALAVATALLESPKMLNARRGLWGYTGRVAGGGPLVTVQSTGMGGPSAAIVVEELIDLGARTL